jgi:hypothetical protein
LTFFAGVLLGLEEGVGEGVEDVAAICDGVGLSGAEGAVCGEEPALQAAVADATTKAPATAKALRRKRTGASTSLTIAPSADVKARVSGWLLITQQLPGR